MQDEEVRKRVLIPNFATDNELEEIIGRINHLLSSIWGHTHDGDVDLKAKAQHELHALMKSAPRIRLEAYLMPYALVEEVRRYEIISKEEARRYCVMHYLFPRD